jgi:hypothetical protein
MNPAPQINPKQMNGQAQPVSLARTSPTPQQKRCEQTPKKLDASVIVIHLGDTEQAAGKDEPVSQVLVNQELKSDVFNRLDALERENVHLRSEHDQNKQCINSILLSLSLMNDKFEKVWGSYEQMRKENEALKMEIHALREKELEKPSREEPAPFQTEIQDDESENDISTHILLTQGPSQNERQRHKNKARSEVPHFAKNFLEKISKKTEQFPEQILTKSTAMDTQEPAKPPKAKANLFIPLQPHQLPISAPGTARNAQSAQSYQFRPVTPMRFMQSSLLWNGQVVQPQLGFQSFL